MKETYFAQNFSSIFEYIWSLLKNSQERVQQLGPTDLKPKMTNLSTDLMEKVNEKTNQNEKVQHDEYSEQLIQLGFDIFQYTLVKLSVDQVLDLSSQLSLFVNSVF